MKSVAKHRLSKEDIQKIIDSRLAVILEKELRQNEGSSKECGPDVSSPSKTRNNK